MESDTKQTEMYLPALRGSIGDWVYYSCLISLKDLTNRTSLVEDFHSDTTFAERIQRDLDPKRSKQIADYITSTRQRFFNSLVIGVYEGNPKWLPFDDMALKNSDSVFEATIEKFSESLGFLHLDGSETLFAIDGQHRIAGFKKYMKTITENKTLEDSNDTLSALFVSHIADIEGKKRTRRLFTTLNKYAKPVSKKDIIFLDEDDLPAIITRKLLDEYIPFANEKIALKASATIDTERDTKSLITIITLYDILKKLLKDRKRTLLLVQKINILLDISTSDGANFPEKDVQKAYEFSVAFLEKFFRCFPEVDKFFKSDINKVENLTEKYRNSHILYRPIGWNIFTDLIFDLLKQNKNYKFTDCFEAIKKLPVKMDEEPYQWLAWNPKQTAMSKKNNSKLIREILLYMLDEYKGSEEELKKQYLEAGGEEAKYKALPAKIS